jgi:lipid-binding SYLF domain-containing protein
MMMRSTWLVTILVIAALLWTAPECLGQEKGKTKADELTTSSQAALQELTASVPLAKLLESKALAILVFPNVTKAGLGIGGQYGEGALLKKNTATAGLGVQGNKTTQITPK